jgi:phytoene dehydrogenase-like protein
MSSPLDQIAEILSEVELADDTAAKLYSLMSTFESANQRTYRRLMAVGGFKKLWEGIAEAVDRTGGFDGRGS